MKNKRDVIIHEISHLAAWDIDANLLKDFFVSQGWKYTKGKPPIPPKENLLPDSATSPGDDFANSIELYYSDPDRLKKFNLNSFIILERIIKSKENP